MDSNLLTTLRLFCLAVSFPVGLGSGLIPQPMVMVLPQKTSSVCKEAEKNTNFTLEGFFIFPR